MSIPRTDTVACGSVGATDKARPSAESLGEDEDSDIETLVGRPLRWSKLSHPESGSLSDKEILTTYRLQRIGSPPDLKGKSYFYWSSGSSFLEALKHFPEIAQGWYGCGLGHTYKVISQRVPPHHVRAYLNHAQWLQALQGSGLY